MSTYRIFSPDCQGRRQPFILPLTIIGKYATRRFSQMLLSRRVAFLSLALLELFVSTIIIQDHFSGNEELTFECSAHEVESVKNEDYWVARIRNISSGEAQNDFTVTVKINGEPVGTVTYSPMNYCCNALTESNNEDLKNVVRAFYLYTEAAKGYFLQVV